MKKRSVVLVVIITIFIAGCTDSKREKLFNYGSEFKIEMYSGGQLVRSWISTGKVSSENGSDGYYFRDKATGKLVEISGDIVITNN